MNAADGGTAAIVRRRSVTAAGGDTQTMTLDLRPVTENGRQRIVAVVALRRVARNTESRVDVRVTSSVRRGCINHAPTHSHS